MIIAIIIAILGVLEQFDWANVIPEHYAGAVVTIISGIMIWLRAVTKTSMGKKE